MDASRSETAESIPSIWTPRLELVAMRPECLQSEQRGDGSLGQLLAVEMPPEWPPEVWEPHVWELLLQAFNDRQQIAWHRYVILREPRIVIGIVNAFRWPKTPGEAEVGYAIAPQFWKQGLGREAAEALVRWIVASGQVTRLCAHTFPEIGASVRILERCGFVLEGPGVEPGTVRYVKSSVESG